MTTLGIIIPNFNHGSSITETIDSILSQTVLPDEIVIIDDASTDNSLEIITSLSKNIPIIRLFRNEENRGVNYCMNLGTRKAQSDLIIYRAADDVFIQNAILNAQKLSSNTLVPPLLAEKQSFLKTALKKARTKL